MSTYNWDISQSGNIRLTGKMVPAGVDPYPLLSAGSLSWDGVEVDDTTLYTTDDLLDYIKGGNSDIIGRIDELELSNAGYEIRCDKSVCYVGDTLSRVPIYVYKNGTLLNWSDILAEGITLKSPITKPSGAIDLILFTSNGLWLAGTTNVAGTYVFEFLKNNVVVASFRFMVLMKAYKSTIVTAYKSSSELPSKPQGASYDFSTTPGTLTMGNDGWATSSTGLSGTIWFCTGYVSEGASSSIDWNEPCIYLTEEIVMQEADHRVKEIAIYKAEKTGTSATTPTGGSYLFDANNGEGSFTCPTGWSLEPNAAVAAYKADSNVASADKDNYKIWKSYNSYQCTVTGDTTLTYGTVTESGWTTPVIYLDIDGILNDADTRAQATFNAALGSASTDLQRAAELIENTQPLIDAVNAIFAWRIVGDGTNALDSKYTELEDTSGVDKTMDGLHALFDGYYSSSNNRYEGTIAALNANPNICISAMEFKAIKFGSITDLNSSTAVTNKWVAYIPTTTEIRTQIASLSDDLSQLNTTVNQQTPEWIRLQASKGFLDNVTWTMVPEAEYTSATNKVDLGSAALPTTEYVASTNTSGYRYGYYYKRTESGVNYWYRCDYPISTGFANILADRVSFGVTNNLSGSDSVKGALIDMTVDGVSITGSKIVLNGDAIANAIAGKSLNINNTSYINSDGSVYFGMPSNVNLNELSSAARETFLSNAASAPVSSRFNANGSGLLCGGNIMWRANGSLYVKSAYIGNNNEWAIKSTDTTPAIPIIYSKDSSTNQELYISPQYIKSIAAPTLETPNPNPDWEILRNGSATFAHGKAVFNAGGSFHIGGASNEVYNVLVTENGQTVTKQEHAGYIDYVPGTGLLTISGDRVNIASSTMAQIGAGLSQDNDFVGLIATQAGVDIKGDLNTEDLSIGNGACFFKGDNNTANTSHGALYTTGSAGSGHLANGNIKWNKNGSVSVKGNITATSFTTQSNGHTAFSITTLNNVIITDREREEAGLTEASDYTPVMLVYERDENGIEINRYIVPLNRLGGGTERDTVIYASGLFTDLTSVAYSSIISGYSGNKSITKTTTTANNVTSTTYTGSQSGVKTYYKCFNTGNQMLVPVVDWENHAAAVDTYIIAKYEISNDNTSVSTTYSIIADRPVRDGSSWKKQGYLHCPTYYDGSKWHIYKDNANGWDVSFSEEDGFNLQGTTGSQRLTKLSGASWSSYEISNTSSNVLSATITNNTHTAGANFAVESLLNVTDGTIITPFVANS